MDEIELKKIIETLLFITDEPLSAQRIAKICEIEDVEYIKSKLEELKHEYDLNSKALSIVQVAGGWQMATRPEYGIWVRKLYQTRLTLRLSNAALEVLAIIAFRQPVTKAEIEAIRGVDSSGPLDTLLERKLITSIGRKETLGRPIIYGTTEEFLKQFGLNSLEDLPKLETIIPPEIIKEVEEKIANSQKVSNEENDSSNQKPIEQSSETNESDSNISKKENIEKSLDGSNNLEN
jgi:segregation and condensation protein B